MTTKTSKHTPGPWRLVGRTVQGQNFTRTYSEICSVTGGTPDQANANACLMSLAWMLPDLVEALEHYMSYPHPAGEKCQCLWCEKTRAELARYHEQEASR